jgi:hypothetical protein
MPALREFIQVAAASCRWKILLNSLAHAASLPLHAVSMLGK